MRLAAVTQSELRDLFRARRNTLSATECRRHSEKIVAHLAEEPVIRAATTIAMYAASNNEVDVSELAATYPAKQFCLPIVAAEGVLKFFSWQHGSALVRGKFGIPVPDCASALPITLTDIDVFVVPLVVFDAACNRIGMGGGYYDRTLANVAKSRQDAWLAGVAYALQYTDKIAANPWDIALDSVFTENETYRRTGN